MIGAGEASIVTANLPRIRLEIDVDLQLDPSRPIQQEQDQYQKRQYNPLFPLQWICNPALEAGFCIWSPMAPRKLDLANFVAEC